MKPGTPILIPYEPQEFWDSIRRIIREEVPKLPSNISPENFSRVPGMTEKPLYRMDEICKIFSITRPTVYEWIKSGKLKKLKIRSRVYFLGSDVQELMRIQN